MNNQNSTDQQNSPGSGLHKKPEPLERRAFLKLGATLGAAIVQHRSWVIRGRVKGETSGTLHLALLQLQNTAHWVRENIAWKYRRLVWDVWA